MRKKAGNLSVAKEELDIKSTGARNDYILGLASANAHQEQYFKHDLQVDNFLFKARTTANLSLFEIIAPNQFSRVFITASHKDTGSR